jgi:hypothetical protein
VLLEIRNHTTRVMDGATLAAVFGNRPVAAHEVFAPDLSGGEGI